MDNLLLAALLIALALGIFWLHQPRKQRPPNRGGKRQ
jgi:hypothetical protein